MSLLIIQLRTPGIDEERIDEFDLDTKLAQLLGSLMIGSHLLEQAKVSLQ
jgi:hypothetical protein